MTSQATDELSREEQFDEILVEYYEHVEHGTIPEPKQFVAQHPDFTTELWEFFEDQQHFAELVKPSTSAIGSTSEPKGPSGTGSENTGRSDSAPDSEASGPPTTPYTPQPSVLLETVDSPGTDQESNAAPDLLGDGRRYRTRQELGRGGLGRVLLAEDLQLSREVAIKECLPRGVGSKETKRRFLQEARITGQLEHPGIVPVYELGVQSENRPYYCMKLLRGRTLATEIMVYHLLAAKDPQRPLRLSKLLQVFVDVCNAVGYAHSRGVLHRDLKPQNIMLGDFGEATVVDWGLAKLINTAEQADSIPASGEALDTSVDPELGLTQSHDKESGSATSAGTILGTPAYMSPEQASGKIAKMDQRSDIFALGIVLYEILVGRRPFEGTTRKEIIDNVRKGVATPPRRISRTVPRALQAICLKAMARRSEDRYSSATALGEDISRWQAGEPVTAYAEPWYQRSWRWLRKHQKTVSMAAAAVLVAAAFLVVRQWSESRRVDAVRNETEGLLRGARESYLNDDMEEARIRLTGALARVGDEAKLSNLGAQIEQLLVRVEDRISERQRQQAAVQRLTSFRRLRDQTLFHGTLFTGTDIPENLKAARSAAQKALALFAVSVDQVSMPVLDPKYFSTQQREEVIAGCRELLLIYASVIGHVPATASTEVRRDHAEQALAILSQLHALGAPTKACHLLRRLHLEAIGRRQEAREAAVAEEQTPASNASDLFLTGQIHFFDRGDHETAIRFFSEALRHQPDHFWSHYFLAVCLLELDRPSDALAHLAAAQSHKHRFVWIHVLRGYALGRLKSFDLSEIEFQKALAIDAPEYGKYGIYVNRGGMRIEHGNLDAAIADLRRAIEIRPDGYQAHLNLGEALRRSGEPQQALEHLNQAVELAPRVSKCFRARGAAHLDRQQLEPALADFEQAIQLEQKSSQWLAEIHFERARVLDRLGRPREAVNAYQSTLELSPGHRQARWLQAQALLALGEYDRAMQSLDKYLEPVEAKGIDVEAYRQRGFEQAKRGHHAAAIADYTRSLQQSPGSAETLGRRGWALLNHSHEVALRDFEHAIKVQPKNGDLYNGRGYAPVDVRPDQRGPRRRRDCDSPWSRQPSGSSRAVFSAIQRRMHLCKGIDDR